ncbi:MAG: bifunctional DNA-formamidopyrimidine glycosylase/DNA-(apurinic or apyrimidinic site) lyase [Rickettsiales bacterium]|nr:bifunctional DNA-formamidopyrimidine glycosylase/DNA-(apurinic or apyrimidinic site) lyase [Rickettsiales bacterium]
MPELPEVETTRRGLHSYLNGKTIENVEVRRRDLRWEVPGKFEEVLEGQKLESFRRVGKYLVLDLPNKQSIIGHLGMSGTFRVEPHMPDELRKHDHVILHMDSAEVAIFNDPRRFGFLLLCQTAALLEHPRLNRMGSDPFDEAKFTVDYLQTKLAKRKGHIKPVLLDQALIAGIGNIYASEALFMSFIHPKRAANSLTRKEITILIQSIKEVLEAAIASGGSTLRDFLGSDGEAGYFQHAFKVYGHAKEPCSVCSSPLEVEVMAGRSTFFCENCQK